MPFTRFCAIVFFSWLGGSAGEGQPVRNSPSTSAGNKKCRLLAHLHSKQIPKEKRQDEVSLPGNTFITANHASDGTTPGSTFQRSIDPQPVERHCCGEGWFRKTLIESFHATDRLVFAPSWPRSDQALEVGVGVCATSRMTTISTTQRDNNTTAVTLTLTSNKQNFNSNKCTFRHPFERPGLHPSLRQARRRRRRGCCGGCSPCPPCPCRALGHPSGTGLGLLLPLRLPLPRAHLCLSVCLYRAFCFLEVPNMAEAA